MNADGEHVTNVLLYYPITTMWAQSDPFFSGKADYQKIGQAAAWKNGTVLVKDYYTRITQRLSDRNWDYNVADDEYLAKARVEGNELVISHQRFRAIILPPITVLNRATLTKLEEFHRAGGIVIGIRQLPTASPKAGDNDATIKEAIASIFGLGATHTPDEAKQPAYYIHIPLTS